MLRDPYAFCTTLSHLNLYKVWVALTFIMHAFWLQQYLHDLCTLAENAHLQSDDFNYLLRS